MELVSARFSDVLRVAELRTKIISVSTFSLGTVYAAYHLGEFSLVRTIVMLIAVLGVDMGTTAFNSYYDARGGVDTRKDNRERDKVIVHSGLSSGFALLVALGCFAVAAVFGLVLSVLVGTEVLAVGAICMLVGFLYTGGPLPISRTPLGEVFAGGFLGGVLFVLSYYVQTETVNVEVIHAALPSLLLVASILAANNTCDREGDRRAGRQTLAVLLGRPVSEAVIYSLGAAAHGLLLLHAWHGIAFPRIVVPAAAASFAYAVYEYVRMHRRGYSHETKPATMQSISGVFLVYTVATFASLVIGHGVSLH
ncbi:MAG: prenyltransferase [Spirochaetaceae bacterium]